MRIPKSLAPIFLGLGLGLAQPAWSHAHLDSASPADGAVLAATPEALVLVFTEALELGLSSLTLTDAGGTAIGLPAPAHEGDDPKSLRVTLPQLAPGTYRASWSITSVDTHSTSGSLAFTVN